MVEHTQAHAGQVHVQRPFFVFTRYQYRLVDGIGPRQCQAVTGRFVAIGAAQQVNIPVPERLYRRLPAGETQHPHWQLQGLADQACILGGQALVVVAATGDVERRIVGADVPSTSSCWPSSHCRCSGVSTGWTGRADERASNVKTRLHDGQPVLRRLAAERAAGS